MGNERAPHRENETPADRQQEINTKRALARRLRRMARVDREIAAELDAIMDGREPETHHFK
jgi:hypothetical protein